MDENDIRGNIYRHVKTGELFIVKESGTVIIDTELRYVAICQSLKNGGLHVYSHCYFFDGRFQYEGKINH